MIFIQYYLDCLSHASYLVGDETTGRALVVDPQRDVAGYLADAQARGLRIEGVVNTHFHADFVAGHLELAQATGAWIGYGEAASAEYPIRRLADGERVVLGDVVLEVMATPGHTPESVSLLVYGHADDAVAYGVLTGDALFVGDVGRPDLLASIGFTADELGRMLYDTVQRRLMALPDEVRVFPAHGAGSACGKNLSTERSSTIGRQRLLNYACQPMGEEEFLAVVTAGQPPAPGYFLYDAVLNRSARGVLPADRALPALDTAGVAAALAGGAVVVDARDTPAFAAGHLAGALGIPADGRFAETAGMLLRPEDPVVVAADPGGGGEVATRLSRIGFDNAVGYVADVPGTLVDLADGVERASRLTPPQLAAAMGAEPAPCVLDVRNEGELASGSVPGAVHVPLAQLAGRLAEVPFDRPVVAYCAGGWRSAVAASYLRHRGHPDASDLLGGFAAWQVMHEPVAP